MIKTLRSNNGSFASLGSVTVQPVASHVSKAKAAKQPTHQSTIGVTPTSEAKLSIHTLTATEDVISLSTTTTLSEIGAKFGSEKSLIIPLQSSFNINTLVPSHHLSLEVGAEYDPLLNKGFVTTTTKFLPYESLTGISQERPEIIMVTSFEPLFNYDVSRTAPKYSNFVEDIGNMHYATNAGKFLDAQSDLKSLMTYNVQTLISTLRKRFPNIDQLFSERRETFTHALRDLDAMSTFLLNLIRMLEAQKQQLDLRHDIYIVNPSEAGSLLLGNYTQQQVQSKPAVLSNKETETLLSSTSISRLVTRHKPQYDFVDMLTELGYKKSTVKNIFSSSKIWLQLLSELAAGLKFHTLQFIDIDPTYQREDKNPTTILVPNVTRFALSKSLPNLPNLDQLINLQPDGITQAINLIKPSFQTIYQNVSFKNEEARIAALAHLVSTEYTYSYGLTQPEPIRILNDYYGFTVSPKGGNTTMFDSIVGKFGNNITDFPLQATNALTSVAQLPQGAFGVLTFESKYVQGDTGTLTPGSDYFFDRVLQTTGKTFNTANLDTLVNKLQGAQTSFSTIVDGLNLLSRPASQFYGAEHLSKASVMTTTNDLINAVKDHLVNSKGHTTKLLQDDRLASVFARARKDDGVKAALFLYVVCKSTRGYVTNVPFLNSNGINGTGDNTPTVDHLIDLINNALKASLPVTKSANSFIGDGKHDVHQVNSPHALNPEGVASALRKGTPLTALVFQLFSQLITDFRVNSTAIADNVTVYGGYLDTIVMMTAFDLIVSIIARYGSTDMIGVTKGAKPSLPADTSYIVNQTSTNHRNSVNELRERALGEDTRIQQMIFTISNALTVLLGSVQGINNYLTSHVAVHRLNALSSILGNNTQLMEMLLSEQQIMMFAAQVENMLAANEDTDSTPPWSKAVEKANQEIKILDESQVPKPLEDAVLGYFGTSEFSSAKGFDKKILTVGIPHGFTQNMKQVVNIQQQKRASFQNKQNDIVCVCVYKVDMVNSDIIYKPIKFPFELSRFPVRISTNAWRPLPKHPGIHDIINAIPTLNFGDNIGKNPSAAINDGVEYASPTVAGHDNPPEAVAMTGDEYSFLSSNQKTKILQNHVVSQLLETYIKLMTGLSVTEYSFDIPPPQTPAAVTVATPLSSFASPLDGTFLKSFTNAAVQHVSDQVASKAASSISSVVGGLMFSTTAMDPPVSITGGTSPFAMSQPQLSNASGVAGNIAKSSQSRAIRQESSPTKTLAQMAANDGIDQNLHRLTPRNIPVMLEALRTIGSFSNMLSDVSSTDHLRQKILNPKQFDRVFSIVVDPTVFLVDVEKTTSTPYGKAALRHMIENGEIVAASENDITGVSAVYTSDVMITPGARPFTQGRAASNVNAYKYRNRNTSEGDLIADKYFVTIETFNEGT